VKRARTGTAALVSLTLVVGIACSATSFDTTWHDPNARPIALAGKRVVAIFMTNRPGLRRTAEDAMAAEITARGGQGVPAYTVLSDEEVKNPDASKEKLRGQGFSGAVVMRVVGHETQYTYQPAYWGGPYYHHFWGGYWGWGWGRVYAPGYLVEDRVVRVETLVYSLDQDLLLWAGVSRTVDPAGVQDLISDLAKAVTKEMDKAGLFQKS
jgi:hypothetical protein